MGLQGGQEPDGAGHVALLSLLSDLQSHEGCISGRAERMDRETWTGELTGACGWVSSCYGPKCWAAEPFEFHVKEVLNGA